MKSAFFHYLVWLAFLGPAICSAQSAIIRGRVSSSQREPLPGVNIALKNGTPHTVTNTQGKYRLENVPQGLCTLTVSYLGHRTSHPIVRVGKMGTHEVDVIMEEEVAQLTQLEVTGQSEGVALKQSPQSVSVIETKAYRVQSIPTNDLVNRVAGVRVRQQGGLGSASDVSIQGISGKQVKFFIDGIPLDYLGSGMGLNALPINLVERIEVYKGVVPIELGADALGGAIHIITRQDVRTYLDASYGVGSFGTQQASLNARHVDSSGFLLGFNGFFNHSNNTYQVDVDIPDAFGTPRKTRVRRFHDRFTNYLGRVEVGFQNQKWADYATLRASFSGLKDQIQHNAVMSQPYGEATNQEEALNLLATYQKKEFMKRLDLNAFAGYSRIIGHFTDTTLNAYTWDGQVYTRRASGGEISSSMNFLRLTTDNWLGRLHAVYGLGGKGSLRANVFTAIYLRRGRDPVAARYYGEDYYSSPTTLSKTVVGLAYANTALDQKLSSITSFKYYTYRSQGFVLNNAVFDEQKQARQQYGFSQATSYRLSSGLLAKLSYEYATRLPDEFELFGDFILTRPNPGLVPETSHNVNAGLGYQRPKLSAELNGFYRFTDQIIYLQASQFYAQYRNLLKARVLGVEGEASYRPFAFLTVTGNATFQDIRNTSPKENSGVVDNRYYRARLPNIPYLFAHLCVQYRKMDWFKKGNRFQCWWNADYVHWFYLYWAVDGLRELKNQIPSQLIQSVGLSYSLQQNRVTVSAEIHNLTNANAYDNFSVQRPERSFHLKLSTFLAKRHNPPSS